VLSHQPGLDQPPLQLEVLGLTAQQCDRLLGCRRHDGVIGGGDVGLQCFEPFSPSGATSPISAAWPRLALTSWVRCRTSSSRTGNNMAAACCSADLTGTLAIEGWVAAMLIASASLRSFLARLTNGLAYCGGSSRARWPSALSSRPQ
jgi:hypothetical protein